MPRQHSMWSVVLFSNQEVYRETGELP